MPVLEAGGAVYPPADNADDVVHVRIVRAREDPACVLVQWCRVHAARNGPPGVNFRHHVLFPLDAAVLRDGRVGEKVDVRAALPEGAARAARVGGGALGVAAHVGAEALIGLGTAREIGAARVVRHVSRLFDKLERPRRAATVAGAWNQTGAR